MLINDPENQGNKGNQGNRENQVNQEDQANQLNQSGEPVEMATVGRVLQVMNDFAPPELAENWDPVGLQVGDPGQPVSRAMLALDVTGPVLAAAAAAGCSLLIVHHPLIFTPLSAIRADIPEQKLVQDLLVRRISLIAAHTNLDAAAGGVADCLADTLGFSWSGRFSAGKYGRGNDLVIPELLSHFLARVRVLLGSCGCRVNTDQDRLIRRVAVIPGSFSEDCLPLLQDLGVDCLVCGELKHHHGLMLAARGIAAVDTGHDVSERVVLQPLAWRLTEKLPEISFAVSAGFDYNKMAF